MMIAEQGIRLKQIHQGPLDPRAFRARILRHLERIAEAGRGGGYVIYVIKDPRGGDPRDPTDGTPFYVGQTANLGRRARAHLARTGAHTTKNSRLLTRMHEIMADGKLPVFQIVERVESRIASLAAETRWAQTLIGQGAQLVNSWEEHRPARSGNRNPAGPVPLERLWDLTVREAVREKIGLAIDCPACRLQVPLCLIEVADRSSENARLSAIGAAVSCPGCGRRRCIVIRRQASDKRSSRSDRCAPCQSSSADDSEPLSE
jgi:hypothetical protein